MVATRILTGPETATVLAAAPVASDMQPDAVSLVLEHERIRFSSYPYEWPAEMLHAAADLTLDLAEQLLDEGLGLKDATPYNVLFRGPQPVFVDVLSFERRDPLDATWLAYAQFVRTFLLPLLAYRTFGLPLRQVFEASRDGLEPETLYRIAGPLRRLRSPFLSLVTLPTWLGGHRGGHDPGVYRHRQAKQPQQAQFVLRYLFRHVRRLLRHVGPQPVRRSTWSEYASGPDARRPEIDAKRNIVRQLVAEFRLQHVLDVGCNTGYLSAVAAQGGARVVAIDYDPVVVGEAWRRAKCDRLDVLPLVVDLTRPSPALGWRNRECPAFLERVREIGGFDAVFMFAVIHHMLVSERIPLPQILDLAAELTTDIAVIEFVPPADPLFQRLARGREALFSDLSAESFEAAAAARFERLRSVAVPGTSRRVYVLRRRNPT